MASPFRRLKRNQRMNQLWIRRLGSGLITFSIGFPLVVFSWSLFEHGGCWFPSPNWAGATELAANRWEVARPIFLAGLVLMNSRWTRPMGANLVFVLIGVPLFVYLFSLLTNGGAHLYAWNATSEMAISRWHRNLPLLACGLVMLIAPKWRATEAHAN
jgi:hypothetical protein